MSEVTLYTTPEKRKRERESERAREQEREREKAQRRFGGRPESPVVRLHLEVAEEGGVQVPERARECVFVCVCAREREREREREKERERERKRERATKRDSEREREQRRLERGQGRPEAPVVGLHLEVAEEGDVFLARSRRQHPQQFCQILLEVTS